MAWQSWSSGWWQSPAAAAVAWQSRSNSDSSGPGGWWQSPAAAASSWQEGRRQNPPSQQFAPEETVYSTWPMNKQDFDQNGQDSFQTCKEVAEYLGCTLKLRGRATKERPDRGNFLTIQGHQCFAVYDMLMGVAKRREHDMSKVLLPHEGVMRRLTTWQEEKASTQQAKLETNETEDSAGADEQQQQADANKPAPDMEPLPPDDDYDDSVPDWGEAREGGQC